MNQTAKNVSDFLFAAGGAITGLGLTDINLIAGTLAFGATAIFSIVKTYVLIRDRGTKQPTKPQND